MKFSTLTLCFVVLLGCTSSDIKQQEPAGAGSGTAFFLNFNNQTQSTVWLTGGTQGNSRQVNPGPGFSQQKMVSGTVLGGQFQWQALDGIANFAWATSDSTSANTNIAAMTLFNKKLGQLCPPGTIQFRKPSSQYVTCVIVKDENPQDDFVPQACVQYDYENMEGQVLIGLFPRGGTCENRLITIRPFGDSITYGVGYSGYSLLINQKGGGYRGWMTTLFFTGDGFAFAAVGNEEGGSTSVQWDSGTYRHDGYPGWRNDQLAAIATIPTPANITLVHAGTNDVLQNASASTAFDRLTKLLDNLRAADSETIIYVAQIIPFAKPLPNCPPPAPAKECPDLTVLNGTVQAYNAKIATLPEKYPSKLVVVNMYKALSPNNNYYSTYGIHPNESGYRRMACTWLKAMEVTPRPKSYTPTQDPCSR